MMAATAVIGLGTGKRLLISNCYCSDFVEKVACTSDQHQVVPSTKNVITAKKSSNYGPNFLSSQHPQFLRAVKEHVDTASSPYTVEEPWPQGEETSEPDYLVNALLLLQKSMLEKQWNLSPDTGVITDVPRERPEESAVNWFWDICSKEEKLFSKRTYRPKKFEHCTNW